MTKPIQQELLPYDCKLDGHNMIAADDGYYKYATGSKDEHDKSRVFRVFICSRCAFSKEVCVVDRNRKETTQKRRRK